MRLLRELSLYWVPLIAVGTALIVFLILGIRFAKELNEQYRVKRDERDDAIKRVQLICRNATLVHETNYGGECRKFSRMSETVPIWEALAGTAETYYGICDARRGCGIGVTIMLMVIAAMAAGLFVVCKFSYGYRDRVRGWNDQFDHNFILDNHPHPPHHHDHRHRGIAHFDGAHED